MIDLLCTGRGERGVRVVEVDVASEIIASPKRCQNRWTETAKSPKIQENDEK